MKRRNYLLTFFVTMLLLSLQGISVQASDHLVKVSLEVSQVLEGHVVDAKGTFKYMLTSGNESNPLPESAKSEFVFEIEGSNTLRLPAIEFMEFGTYIYTVKQLTPTPIKGVHIDDQLYTIEIYVTLNEYREPIAHTIIKQEDHLKVEKLQFINTFDLPKTDDLPSTGMNQAGDRVGLVLIGLGVLLFLYGRKNQRDNY